MPETIDGVVYPTTPVIPASTNTPAGGNRPYPTGASPGKALWQLLKRAMDELDKFEAGPIRTLTDRVVSAENKIASASVARRFFTKSNTQVVPANSYARIVWTGGDARRADTGQPATGTPGIRLSADGATVTCEVAGMYTIYALVPANVSQTGLAIRKNGLVMAKAQSNQNFVHQVWLNITLAANDVIDVYFFNGFTSNYTLPPNTPRDETTTFERGAYDYFQFDVIRWGV